MARGRDRTIARRSPVFDHRSLGEADGGTTDCAKLFRKTFSFTGGEIVNEFLTSIGYLPCTHDESCPAYKKIIKQNPMWMRK